MFALIKSLQLEPTEHLQNYPPFDEDAWIRLIFLLSDTQDWLTEMVMGAVMQVPMKNRKRLFRKTYYINISALAHILERHYHKVRRHRTPVNSLSPSRKSSRICVIPPGYSFSVMPPRKKTTPNSNRAIFFYPHH
jgi:hypothetical protein